MSEDRALVLAGSASPAGPRRCPRCAERVDLGEPELTGRRARCASCGLGIDVLSARSPDGGPLRTFDEVLLVPDEAAVPARIGDQSGGLATRRVVVDSLMPRAKVWQWLLHLAGPALIMIGPVRSLIDGRVGFTDSLLLILAVVWSREFWSGFFRVRTEILSIEGSHLVIRRVGSLAFARRIPLSRIVDVELEQMSSGPGLYLRVRSWIPGRRRIPLAAGLNRITSDLEWLRDHLRAGIATARDDRGRLPPPGDRPALSAPCEPPEAPSGE